MKTNLFLRLMLIISLLPALTHAQDDCSRRTEKIIGKKGSQYTVPCKDMVIMDIETYTKYRYSEKQYRKIDSVVVAYNSQLDSLHKEHERGKELLEEKLRNKDDIIDKYKSHSQEVTSVLEKCKTDSENFTKVYEEKITENRRLKRQRKGFLGLSGGLTGALVLVLLL